MKRIFLTLIIITVFLVSCVKYMDEVYVPSYIEINSINVSTSGSQGSSSSNITDAWIYLDGADLGAYPLPARIPLLASGEHVVRVAPGIKLNGIASTRVSYPLVEPIEIDLNLHKDSVMPLEVNMRYYSNSIFDLVEDFEDNNPQFETTVNSKADWGTSSSGIDPSSWVFEGFHSGKSILNEEDDYLQIITKEMFQDLPKQGLPVFIEMDFKTNATIVLSFMSYVNGIGESFDLIYLNPTEEWKKIYINLTSTISYQPNIHDYKFLISANHSTNNVETVVLIDNFKIVHREVEK